MGAILFSLCSDPAVAPCAGVANWQRPIKQADGEAITLYDHQLGSSDRHGDPIADVYAFIARPNNAILAVADGWNWGLKSRQAARCAVQGCVERLNKSFFSENPPVNTQQVTACIRESFDYAQELIMKHEGTTTTLCVAVICSLAKSKGEWGLCVVSVGNSSCFVWQNRASLVYEVTFSASVTKKDTLDYGGCLGPSIGDDPDLSNLVCCYTTVLDDDIVFLTTDGISNNFDPVALLEGTTEIQNVRRLVTALEGHRHLSPTLPLLTQEQREVCKLSNLSNVLQKSRSQKRSDHLSALSLKDALVEYVVEVTEAKRTFLERSWRDIDDPDLTPEERASKEREIFQLADSYPGKLDHATVVAYQVGTLSENSRYTKAKAFLFSPTQRFARKETGDDDDN